LEKIIIKLPGSVSEILVGVNWESVNDLLPETGVAIITDDNIFSLYGDRFPKGKVIPVPPGEGSKKLKVIESIGEKLLEAGIDRTGFILAIGGGVVCDIAGFMSAVYMRGIRCGYISTSLLSQVDASTGGKNGVNLGSTKNIIGTIRQPEFVICDQSMLLTLSDEEFLSGVAELIKTAVIGDRELFDLLEKSRSAILAREIKLLSRLVARSVRFKASVVSEDEREKGLRKILNFGHTYGHAIEMEMNFRHGFAVAAGMELATDFSFNKGFITSHEKDRIINLMNGFGLIKKHYISDDQIEKLIIHDKKRSGIDISFVFAAGIGKATVNKITVGEVIDFYKKFRDKKEMI
jgi:3-dehydroquinate synthase